MESLGEQHFFVKWAGHPSGGSLLCLTTVRREFGETIKGDARLLVTEERSKINVKSFGLDLLIKVRRLNCRWAGAKENIGGRGL